MLSSAWMRYCLILWTLDVHLCSRSPQGERGLKYVRACFAHGLNGRSPQGERGLKSIVHHLGGVKDKGRSPQGERGLKYIGRIGVEAGLGRSPQGERGLKFQRFHAFLHGSGSFPARGAWIEIR